MVAPITGPFTTKTIDLGSPNRYGFRPQKRETYRKWYRQQRPYRQPLAYEFSLREGTLFSSVNDVSGPDNTNYVDYLGTPAWLSADVQCRNKAYTRLKAKLGDAAAFAVSIAERKQAMSMMTNRLTQIWKFTHALRKGRFGDAAKALKVGMPPKNRDFDRFLESSRFTKLRKGAKYFANNYLEFHFGWSPMVADIYTAMNILSDGIPSSWIKAKATLPSRSGGLTFTGSQGMPNWSFTRKTVTVNSQVTIRTQVKVQNPNLHLAAQLGVINPATVAFELVPFSFVLDWFVNVSEFLESFTDFAGLELSNTSYTEFVTYREVDGSSAYYNQDRPYNGTTSGKYGSTKTMVWNAIYLRRTVGLPPGPTLTIRSPWVVSPRRGLAAVSLLIQSLKH